MKSTATSTRPPAPAITRPALPASESLPKSPAIPISTPMTVTSSAIPPPGRDRPAPARLRIWIGVTQQALDRKRDRKQQCEQCRGEDDQPAIDAVRLQVGRARDRSDDEGEASEDRRACGDLKGRPRDRDPPGGASGAPQGASCAAPTSGR